MRRRLPLFVLCATLAASGYAGPTEPAVDVPVAPIAPTSFAGWTNAFVLQNPSLEVVIVPALGRIVRLACKGGENLLRLDAGEAPPASADDIPAIPWINHGGNWLWPVAQSRWPELSGTNWPPPAILAEAPWTGSAWKAADDSQYGLLTREYGEPLNLKVSRLIKLDRTNAVLAIRQRAERTAPSDVPVVLWTLTQVSRADRIVLPVDETTTFEQGFKPLLFEPPDASLLTRCPGTLVYDFDKEGERKLGTDSRRGWIAARKGNLLILQRVSRPEEAGAYSDEGCTVEMYSNAEQRYAEIETVSAEKKLLPGESLQQNLTLECLRLDEPLSSCDLSLRLRELVGETAAVETE